MTQYLFNESNGLKEEWFIFRYIPDSLILKRYDCFITFRKAEIEWPLWQNEIHNISTIDQFVEMHIKYPINAKVQIQIYKDDLGLQFPEIVHKIKSREMLLYTRKADFGLHIVPYTDETFTSINKDTTLKRLL